MTECIICGDESIGSYWSAKLHVEATFCDLHYYENKKLLNSAAKKARINREVYALSKS